MLQLSLASRTFFYVSTFLELLETNEVFSFRADFKQLRDDLQHHNVLQHSQTCCKLSNHSKNNEPTTLKKKRLKIFTVSFRGEFWKNRRRGKYLECPLTLILQKNISSAFFFYTKARLHPMSTLRFPILSPRGIKLIYIFCDVTFRMLSDFYLKQHLIILPPPPPPPPFFRFFGGKGIVFG